MQSALIENAGVEYIWFLHLQISMSVLSYMAAIYTMYNITLLV